MSRPTIQGIKDAGAIDGLHAEYRKTLTEIATSLQISRNDRTTWTAEKLKIVDAMTFIDLLIAEIDNPGGGPGGPP